MKRPSRECIVVLLASGIFFLFLLLLAWRFLPGRRAEVRLPPVSAEAVEYTALAVEPIYLQKDPRWGDERIGGSGEAIRSVGCTVCCLSMALARYGIDMDPSELNRRMIEQEGYTRRGWVIWDAIRKVSDGKVQVELPPKPTNLLIEQALAQGDPILVKIILRSGFPHWVLLVGRDGVDYLMKDPLGDGETLEPLSSLGSDILAVRIVRESR